MILVVDQLHAFRQESKILHGVCLKVDEGEIVCLIGRNGMGKTTLLRSIMGMTTITAGHVLFRDQDITRIATHRIARQGIAMVPEGRGIFGRLTINENLKMGRSIGRHRDASGFESVFDQFPFLLSRGSERAAVLSGGQQQVLAIARALVGRPTLLLVDEFSEGIQPNFVHQISMTLKKLNKAGMSILLVEQDARLALELANRAYIMEKGQIVDSGDARCLLEDEERLSRYLVL